MDNCTTCQYYFPDQSKQDYGICRRYPPMVAGPNAPSTQPWFVGQNMWCGEYSTLTPPPEAA